MYPIQCFAMYFVGLVSMSFHPGYHKGEDIVTVSDEELESMCDIALRMLQITSRVKFNIERTEVQ